VPEVASLSFVSSAKLITCKLASRYSFNLDTMSCSILTSIS
jgi:hypothetical protein